MQFAELGTELFYHNFCAGRDDIWKGGQEGETSLEPWHGAPWATTAWEVQEWLSKEGFSMGTAPLAGRRGKQGRHPRHRSSLAAQKVGNKPTALTRQ